MAVTLVSVGGQLFGVRRPVAALALGGLTPGRSVVFITGDCDRSQSTKALTGQRTPK